MDGVTIRQVLGGLARHIGARRLMMIVVLNLIPVAGVAFLGWDAGYILLLYWAENLILGGVALIRILTARGDGPGAKGEGVRARIGLGCFFMVHYGIFCLGHGVFAASMASQLAPDAAGDGGLWARTFGDRSFQIALAATAILQIVALVRDWWMAGRWRDSSPGLEMFRPYGRIAVLHVTVILGAWGLAALNAPTAAVLVLCLLKLGLELGLTVFGAPARRG